MMPVTRGLCSTCFPVVVCIQSDMFCFQEEEEERHQKWNRFLKQQEEYALSNSHTNGNHQREENKSVDADESQECEPLQEVIREGDDSFRVESVGNSDKESCHVHKWAHIRPSLSHIEYMMSFRIKKRKNMKDEHILVDDLIPSIGQGSHLVEDFKQENEKELSGHIVHDGMNTFKAENISSPGVSSEPSFPWNEELEFLVHGGVPRDLRGEVISLASIIFFNKIEKYDIRTYFLVIHFHILQVWQAFVGVTTRRVENYYQDLLASENEAGDSLEHDKSSEGRVNVHEKWRKQIEKVIRCMEPGLYRSVF